MNAVKLTLTKCLQKEDIKNQGIQSQHTKPARATVGTWLLTMGLAVIGVMPVQAVHSASLSDLFSNSASSSGKFLPVEQAFDIMPSIQGDKVSVYINITPEHYVYRDKIKLVLPDGVTATPLQFDKSAHFVDDPTFGKVAVFDQNSVTATATLNNMQGKRLTDVPVTVNWQGCAKAGLCYPPEKTKFVISLDANTKDTSVNNATAKNDSNTTQEPTTKEPAKTDNQTASQPKQPKQPKQPTTSKDTKEPNQQNVTQTKAADASTLATAKTDATGNNTDITVDANTNSDANASVDAQPADPANAVMPTDMPADMSTQAMSTQAAPMQMTATERTAQPNTNPTATGVTTGMTAGVDKDADADANDPFGLARHPALALLLIFLAGLTLAFTPCVLPMLPIVANIVAQQKQVSQRRSIALSSSYALGVAVAYGLLGAVIAYFGQALGILGWLQNPYILGAFALVFVVLALYMLEVVNIRLPSGISQPLQRLSQAGNQRLGSVGGSFLVGLLSALVVSPCVSAPLYGSLLAVATIGSVPLGFAALFLLGLGLSLPLVVLAATGGKLIPKAGEWMGWIKEGMAYLLFAVALLLIERILQSPVMLLLWALWFAVVAFWWHKWSDKAPLLSRAMHYVMLLWAGCLMVGAALGSTDSWYPLQSLQAQSSKSSSSVQSATPAITQTPVSVVGADTGNTTAINSTTATDSHASESHITTLAQLDLILSQYPKVLVDVTADWCIECRIMEKTLFSQPPQELADWHLVRLDITETTDHSKAILQRYQLFGPPSLLYYVDGELKQKQVGEIKRDVFTQTLATY